REGERVVEGVTGLALDAAQREEVPAPAVERDATPGCPAIEMASAAPLAVQEVEDRGGQLRPQERVVVARHPGEPGAGDGRGQSEGRSCTTMDATPARSGTR